MSLRRGAVGEYAASVLHPLTALSIALGLACHSPTSPLGGRHAELSPRAAQADRCRPEPAEPRSVPEPLAERLAEFCVDPHGVIRAFDATDPAQLQEVCDGVLGAGCGDGARGLERVVALRYLSASGSGSADVLVSQFSEPALAYVAFTGRLLGDGDPIDLTARELAAVGIAALEDSYVSAWHGKYVLWLRYFDASVPPDQELDRAGQQLPELARALLARLPPDVELPESVERLPERQRLPLGARLLPDDAHGVPLSSRTALGYYRDGEKRWRVLASVRPDAESAKDVLTTLQRSARARKIKGTQAIEWTLRRSPSEPQVSWVLAQHGATVYGVGDEPNALPEFMSAEREASTKLTLHEKLVALTRVHIK